jgi:hypothetical protein
LSVITLSLSGAAAFGKFPFDDTIVKTTFRNPLVNVAENARRDAGQSRMAWILMTNAR